MFLALSVLEACLLGNAHIVLLAPLSAFHVGDDINVGNVARHGKAGQDSKNILQGKQCWYQRKCEM